MASKQIGLGTVLQVDDNDSGSGYTVITLLTDVKPPARKREKVDATALGDTLQTYSMGSEQHSEMEFNQYWHPGDTNHQIMDTLFAAKTQVLWQLVSPHTSAVTDTFEGVVSDLEPNTIKHNEHYMRKVIIQRMTDITRT